MKITLQVMKVSRSYLYHFILVDYLKETSATKRTLTSLYKSLEKEGIDIQAMKAGIKDIVIKVNYQGFF